MHRLLVLLVVALAASGRAVSAQPMNCGAAPRLPVESQQEEKIKVELTGKAQFFSRMAGDSGLKNAVEAERRTIYQSANTIQAAWESAYLSYLFCSTVISDKSLSAQGKLGAILEFRKGMCTVPQDLLIKLAEFVNEGSAMQSAFVATYNEAAIQQGYSEWERKVEKFINDNLGITYTVQFTSADAGAMLPFSHHRAGGEVWGLIRGKDAVLNSIIQELRHC
jgi:hypothetical protein